MINIDKKILQQFHNLPEKIIATIHKDPDYDAIGSLLALNELITALGKNVTLYSPDINYKLFEHLPNIKSIKKKSKSRYDLAIFLDCSDKSRIAQPEQFPVVSTILNIDHHQDNTLFGDLNAMHNISSVGEILFYFFNALKVPITSKIATFLYSAICFDTGNFKFSNTSANTFNVASQLLKTNINASKISEWIFEKKTKNYFEDIRMGLNNMYLDQEEPFMIIHIPNHLNMSNESTINFFRQFENIELIMVCKEIKKSEYRISFRSKQHIDVTKIATSFNGGGHRRAAGATTSSSFNQLKKKLIELSRQAFK